MSAQNLAEQVKSDIQSLQTSLGDLQGAVRLTSIRDSLEDFGSTVNGLDRRIKSLRELGYAFEKELEGQAADFAKEFKKIAPGLEAQIEKEAGELERALRPLESQITQVAGDSRKAPVLAPHVKKLKSEVETLEGRIEAVESDIRGGYDGFSRDVHQLEYHLGKLEWTLRELSEATFDLLATESGIMAVKAVWAKGEKQTKEDPEGVLYLTDQQIIFEQKEKVATKKVLFIATEKELIQETLWQIPVVLLEEAKAYKEGFLNKDDYIKLHFASGAPYDILNLHIWQRGDDWVSLLNRAKAAEFDQTRAIPIDPKVVEKVKNAPTQCPECGGAVNQVILRGMESITCEYCGVPIRW